jgi:hypothetical protein
MTTLLPKEMRTRMLALLRAQAESLDWQRRSALERASFYENWAKDPSIGGVLAQFMDPRKVRVYIKDSLMKPYQRARLHDEFSEVLAALGVNAESIAVQLSFSQPHGRLLADGRVICWGNSRDWKSVLFAVFERAFTRGSVPFAAVLMEAGRPTDGTTKETASEAQSRLGITKLLWTDQQ